MPISVIVSFISFLVLSATFVYSFFRTPRKNLVIHGLFMFRLVLISIIYATSVVYNDTVSKDMVLHHTGAAAVSCLIASLVVLALDLIRFRRRNQSPGPVG